MAVRLNTQSDSLDLNSPKSTWVATAIGVVVAGLTFIVFVGLQGIFESLPAYRLLEAMQSSSTTLCLAGVTSAATIMPLMLTIFSFARRADVNFNSWFYDRIKTICLLCCVTFIAGLLTLIILSAPIGDIDVFDGWYDIVYYLVVIGIAAMGGMAVTILVMLYFSIIHLVHYLHPHYDEEEQER